MFSLRSHAEWLHPISFGGLQAIRLSSRLEFANLVWVQALRTHLYKELAPAFFVNLISATASLSAVPRFQRLLTLLERQSRPDTRLGCLKQTAYVTPLHRR